MVLTAATLAFVCLQLAPGDPATALGEGLSPAARDRMRALYGFDDPVPTQYLRWLRALLTGDLGWSTAQHRPVSAVLADALPNTLWLILPAFAVSVVGGMAIGAWQGSRIGSRQERVTSVVLLTLYSVPEFWLALGLLILFAGRWQLLPAAGITSDLHTYLPLGARLLDRLQHLVLPVTSVALVGIATFARYQRSSMADAYGQPFVRTARASGLPLRRIRRAAWRAALGPVITMGGLLLPGWLAGVVFIEQIYAWPGMGYVLLQAISAHDYAVVSGAVIIGSGMTALAAAGADLLQAMADPRLRGGFADARTATSRGLPR